MMKKGSLRVLPAEYISSVRMLQPTQIKSPKIFMKGLGDELFSLLITRSWIVNEFAHLLTQCPNIQKAAS